MKRSTVERKHGKIGNYAERKLEQLRGVFRPNSPFKYRDGSEGISLETFKKHKKGKFHKP